uniref:Uncharacterized protein n=1 Tax=Sphaerodactylus townsendi TaxID=933632 RepID=A0ACB8EUG0_9SAUR
MQAIQGLQDRQGLRDNQGPCSNQVCPFQEAQTVLVSWMETMVLKREMPSSEALLDRRVHLALQALLDFQDTQGMKAPKDLLAPQAMTDCKVFQDCPVHQASLAHQDQLGHQVFQGNKGQRDPLALKDNLGFQAMQDSQDPKDILGRQGLREMEGFREKMGPRVKRETLEIRMIKEVQSSTVQLSPTVPPALLEILGCQVPRALPDHQVFFIST